MRSALPRWFRVAWLVLSPIGLVFATRITWEKTVWRWTRGPQNIGFSLMHIHPFFAITGIACCYLLMLWLIAAAILVTRRWSSFSKTDGVMIVLCLFVTLAIVVP